MIYSKGPWKAIKNSSWSEDHKSAFGDKAGFVICHRDKQGQSIAVASIIGAFRKHQEEIDSNAKLVAAAPEMLEVLKALKANFDNWLKTGEPADETESERLYSEISEAIRKATI